MEDSVKFGLEEIRIWQIELQSVIFLLRFFVLLIYYIIIHVRIVIYDVSSKNLAGSDFGLELILHLDFRLRLQCLSWTFELSEIFLQLLLLALFFRLLRFHILQLRLRFFLALNILKSVILTLLKPHFRMQLLEESLAIQRVINNLIVHFRRLLVFIKQKVVTLGLPSVDNIVLKLLLVHSCLLVFKIVLFISFLIVFKDCLKLLHVGSGFGYYDSCLCLLCLGFAVNVAVKNSVDESAHFGIWC